MNVSYLFIPCVLTMFDIDCKGLIQCLIFGTSVTIIILTDLLDSESSQQ